MWDIWATELGETGEREGQTDLDKVGNTGVCADCSSLLEASPWLLPTEAAGAGMCWAVSSSSF